MVVKSIFEWLRSAGGERNAAAEPQTEGSRICGKANAACDGRAACEAERSKPHACPGGQPPKTTWRWAVDISGRHARVASSDRDNAAARYRACGRTGEIVSFGQVRFEVVRLA